MKKLFTAGLGAAMMLLVASAAFAFTSYPNSDHVTCPDTLSILRLKTLLNTVAACAPQSGVGNAAGDTVNGVGGIVTGFDENPTGFDVYLQMRQGGPNSGIDVFTGGTNYRPLYGLNRGDSVIVEFARVAVFNGDPELIYPNNIFSGPNMILRKHSSGHALPPFYLGNTTDFNELPTNTAFEPYISALVKLVGPVRVARVGDSFLFKSCLVVRESALSDSVFIDYGKLTTILPPPLGTILTSISGIGNKSTRGYRIMPRDANDIVDAVGPGVSDAYAVANNQYRVVFDRDVTPVSATKVSNYSLASFGSISSVVMDGTNAVVLAVPTLREVTEIVSVDSVVGLANGIQMAAAAQPTFVSGVLSCGEMSAPNPDSLSANPCHDKSKYAGPLGQYINGQFGPRSTVTGIVVGVYGNLYYMEDATPLLPAGNHRGITVFAPPSALTLGHKYVLAGAAQEFYSENEFASIAYVKDVGTPGVPAAIPLSIAVAKYDTCDGNQNLNNARDYLSELVTIGVVKVVQRFDTLPNNGFHVTAGGDTMFCENQNNVLGPSNPASYPALGSIVRVTGCVHYTTNTSSPSFRIIPRNAADIVLISATGVNPSSAGELAFSVFPNPARTVKLSFTLPQAADVDLGVYDLFGRHVATIARGRLEAGSHQKSWNGLNDAGKQARSGMYFYRLRAGNELRTARAILITD